MFYKQQLGQQGEKMVEAYLKAKNYQILERNYRKKTGEIDLIAQTPDKSEVVFIEVKTRKTLSYGSPEEAVDHRKILKIQKTALFWLQENSYENKPWRIDVVALELLKDLKITHLENVTL